MSGRTMAATSMAFTDQSRRPLLLILLVIVPAYVITRSIAITEATPRRIPLPGDLIATTNMQELHGAVMAGFRPGETVIARLTVLAAVTALVAAISMGVTALSFTPASWSPFIVAAGLTGLVYAALGALAGALLDKLAATYLMLFLALTDLGIAQNPMFGNGKPPSWATLLPGYGPGRMMVDGAFSPAFHASGPLVVALSWTVALVLTVGFVLRRAVGTRN